MLLCNEWKHCHPGGHGKYFYIEYIFFVFTFPSVSFQMFSCVEGDKGDTDTSDVAQRQTNGKLDGDIKHLGGTLYKCSKSDA